MADVKISIRFFDDVPVRSVWDDETAKWWMCAADVVEALADTKNPRMYWATVKRRNPELFANCKQLKLPAKDGKRYTAAAGVPEHPAWCNEHWMDFSRPLQ